MFIKEESEARNYLRESSKGVHGIYHITDPTPKIIVRKFSSQKEGRPPKRAQLNIHSSVKTRFASVKTTDLKDRVRPHIFQSPKSQGDNEDVPIFDEEKEGFLEPRLGVSKKSKDDSYKIEENKQISVPAKMDNYDSDDSPSRARRSSNKSFKNFAQIENSKFGPTTSNNHSEEFEFKRKLNKPPVFQKVSYDERIQNVRTYLLTQIR